MCVINRTHRFEDCADLLRIRQRSVFVPTVEVSIERGHATMTAVLRTAPNFSFPFASVHGLRKPEILARLESGSIENEAMFNTVLNVSRTPNSCIESLDLVCHPEIRKFIVDGKLPRLQHTDAAAVIYRTDNFTPYQDLPSFDSRPNYWDKLVGHLEEPTVASVASSSLDKLVGHLEEPTPVASVASSSAAERPGLPPAMYSPESPMAESEAEVDDLQEPALLPDAALLEMISDRVIVDEIGAVPLVIENSGAV